MAIDNTPPRLRLIVTIAVIVVITLVGLDFVFKSYYAYMSDGAQREKLAPTRDRDEARTAEQTSLTSGKVPIEQAMAQIAKGTRDNLIEPRQSDDVAPMSGWSKMPKPTPPPQLGTPTPLPTDPHAPAPDADAAAPHAPAAEAGAPAPHAPAPHAPTPHAPPNH